MSLSAITDRRIHVQPAEVHNVLSRHMLADGYDIVMDLRKSKGSWLFDSRRGRKSCLRKCASQQNRLTIEFQHHVARLETGGFGQTAFFNVRHHHPTGDRQIHLPSQRRGHIVEDDAGEGMSRGG